MNRVRDVLLCLLVVAGLVVLAQRLLRGWTAR